MDGAILVIAATDGLMMPFLSTPMFYITGILTTAFRIRNYLKVRKLPLPGPDTKRLVEEATA